MLSQALNQIVEIAKWGSGLNNFYAIKDVITEEYNYDKGHNEPINKIKQIGTELLHAGLKYATYGTVIDKTCTYLNLFPSPEPETLRKATHILLNSVQDLPAIAFPWVIKSAGIISISAIGVNTVTTASEGLRLLLQPVRIDSEPHTIKFENLVKGLKKIASASVALPVFTATYIYGTTGAAISGLLHTAVIKSESTIIKTAFLGIGLIPILPYL